MDYYAVVGNPISHSRSPRIHQLFAEQTGQQLSYGTLLAPLDGFAQTVQDFFAQPEHKGLNVTVPFKEQAAQLCQIKSERAQLAGAVNTIYLDAEHRLVGDNTDGAGLVADLTVNHQLSLTHKNILLLGAGGAVRGVLQPILKAMPRQVVICNRTLEKADALVTRFGHLGCIRSCSFAALHEPFDLIINGTSASLTGALPDLDSQVIGTQTISYDMMYGRSETVFNQWARNAGAAKTIDGLGMLVEQAAEAFFLWRGIRPDTHPVISALRLQ